MKKFLISTILLTAAVGFLGAGNVVSAADTSSSNTSASTDATVQFTGGTLDLSNTPSTVSFPAAGVADVYAKGYDQNATPALTATVKDFRGNADDEFDLMVQSGGWKESTTGQSNAKLNANMNAVAQLSILQDNDVQGGVSVLQKSGDGEYTMPATDLKLKIAKGAVVNAGSFTNTLTWTLGATPSGTTD